MNEIVHPEAFSEFLSLWLFYVLSWGLVSTIFFLVPVAAILSIFSIAKRQASRLVERLRRLAGFLAILLLVSGVANALWCCLIFGNLYVAHDIDSPEDDFQPFFPIDGSWLTMQHGHTLTVSLFQLQMMWLLFAASAWAISFILYRLIRRALSRVSTGTETHVGFPTSSF
jgi:hypothetical protein